MEEQDCSKCGSKGTESGDQLCPGGILAEKQSVAQHSQPEQADGDFKTSDIMRRSGKFDMCQGRYFSVEKKNRIIEMFISLSGRLNRKRYIGRSLMAGVAVVVGYIMSLLIIGVCSLLSDALAKMMMVILPVFMMGLLMIVRVSLSARRCHDLNKSGWLYIAVIIPILGVLIALYLLFAKGTEGNNKYGEDISEIEGW